MKAIKFIFSKFFPMVLLMLLQLSLIVFVLTVANEYFVLFQVLCDVVAVLTFLKIVNKKTNPEYKIPWIFLILALPVFGLTVYALFANPKLSKRESRRMHKIRQKAEPLCQSDPSATQTALERMDGYDGISRYLSATSKLPCSAGNRVTYYKVGEDMWRDMLDELGKAQKFIFLEYFIVDQGKMWDSIHEILVRKVAEGVEVRMMYDDIGTLTMQRHGYWRELRKEGIDCCKFGSFRPVLSGIYNNRDHRKITVIDGRVGYTGGVNIGDEYINEKPRLGHWKDSGIKIEGPAVANLTAMFLPLFDVTSKEDLSYEKYFPKNIPSFADEGVLHVFGDGPNPYYTEQIGENNFINMIAAAKRYVWITTPYLIIDFNLSTALKNAALRGVDVRIVTPHIPDKKFVFDMTRSTYRQLMKSGVKIYEYTPGFMHAKNVVVDDVLAFVGTINFDYRSLTHHFECGAVMYRTPCIADMVADFNEVFGKSQQIDPKTFKMSKLATFRTLVLQLFAPML